MIYNNNNKNNDNDNNENDNDKRTKLHTNHCKKLCVFKTNTWHDLYSKDLDGNDIMPMLYEMFISKGLTYRETYSTQMQVWEH